MNRSNGFAVVRAIVRRLVTLCAASLLAFASIAPAQAVDGSTVFRDALPDNVTVSAIWLYHDDAGINGLQVRYQLDNGFYNMLPINGAARGALFKLELEPGERLMEVSGTYDAQDRVRTLSFVTDRRRSAVVGATPGESTFQLVTTSGGREFAGFTGYMDPVLIAPQFVTRPPRPRPPVAAPAVAAAPAAPPPAPAPSVQAALPAPSGLAVSDAPAPPARVFKGWHIKSRDFTCRGNGGESDTTAEVYGDLTFAFDTGDGQRSVFLLSRARQYAVAMDCASHAALVSDGFQHVDLVVLAPPRALTAGGFWFISGLKEADDGSFIDPDDDLGGYETVRYPLDTRVPARTYSIDFQAADPNGSAQLRLLLDVTPVIE